MIEDRDRWSFKLAVMTQTHTAHHRGQQLALLRMLAPGEYSNYGPTADAGGLMQNNAPAI
jgi:hypothetical protein